MAPRSSISRRSCPHGSFNSTAGSIRRNRDRPRLANIYLPYKTLVGEKNARAGAFGVAINNECILKQSRLYSPAEMNNMALFIQSSPGSATHPAGLVRASLMIAGYTNAP